MSERDYAAPTVTDYGDLRTLTAACMGTGGEDGAAKDDGNNPFVFSQPDFGDPDYCN